MRAALVLAARMSGAPQLLQPGGEAVPLALELAQVGHARRE